MTDTLSLKSCRMTCHAVYDNLSCFVNKYKHGHRISHSPDDMLAVKEMNVICVYDINRIRTAEMKSNEE